MTVSLSIEGTAFGCSAVMAAVTEIVPASAADSAIELIDYYPYYSGTMVE
jgi:hypothetical protein